MTPTVALFGTSADPPTVGHRAVLEGLTGLVPLVATWASDNPFKQHGAPLELRAALLEAVVRDLQQQVGPGRLELCQDLSSRRVRDSLERAARSSRWAPCCLKGCHWPRWPPAARAP